MNSILSDLEKQSAAWTKVKRHIEQRIEDLRRKNDGDLDPDDTARLRGRIAELKNLLAAVEPPPALASDEP